MRTLYFILAFSCISALFAQKDSLDTEYSTFVYFESGSAVISGEGKFSIDSLMKHFDLKDILEAEVYGHTDNVGNGKYNLELSQRRGESVFAYLRANGLNIKVARFLSVGESDPLENNQSAGGRAKNRRVKLVIRHYSRNTQSQIIYPKE